MFFRKKLAAIFLTLAFMLSAFTTALAQVFPDVADDYWAAEEINDVVSRNVIPLYADGTYRPQEKVPRVEWTEWLLRALGLAQAPIKTTPDYSDVTVDTFGYPSIARSDQFGLIYGYTDGEFKPQRLITKVETASIMSHITKDTEVDTGILNQFADSNQIPNWGIIPFSKAIKYGLYVNYPLETELNPNRQLNRAEAAVLLAKLMKALNLVQDDKKAAENDDDANKEEPVAEEPSEYILSVEHLHEYPKAAVDRVNITNLRRIILAKNVVRVAFAEKFNSKTAQLGDVVTFYFKKDVYTTEGTLIIPANTKLYATVEELRDKKWLNKNAEVYLHILRMVFPNGQEYPFIARVLNDNDGVLTENRWLKPLEYTIGGAVIGGVGVGLPVGEATKHRSGDGMAIGFPAGAGAGLIAGFLTPGVNYKAHVGEEVWVELKVDCSLYNDYVAPASNSNTNASDDE